MHLHQLDHMQTICTSLQTDNTNTSSLKCYRLMLFFTPNQQALKAKTEQLNVTELKMTSSDCTIYAYTQSISIILKVKR